MKKFSAKYQREENMRAQYEIVRNVMVIMIENLLSKVAQGGEYEDAHG